MEREALSSDRESTNHIQTRDVHRIQFPNVRRDIALLSFIFTSHHFHLNTIVRGERVKTTSKSHVRHRHDRNPKFSAVRSIGAVDGLVSDHSFAERDPSTEDFRCRSKDRCTSGSYVERCSCCPLENRIDFLLCQTLMITNDSAIEFRSFNVSFWEIEIIAPSSNR